MMCLSIHVCKLATPVCTMTISYLEVYTIQYCNSDKPADKGIAYHSSFLNNLLSSTLVSVYATCSYIQLCA